MQRFCLSGKNPKVYQRYERTGKELNGTVAKKATRQGGAIQKRHLNPVKLNKIRIPKTARYGKSGADNLSEDWMLQIVVASFYFVHPTWLYRSDRTGPGWPTETNVFFDNLNC